MRCYSGFTEDGLIKSCPILLFLAANGHYHFVCREGRADKAAKKYCHFLSNKNIQMLGEAVVDLDKSLTVTDYIPLYSNYHS